MDLRLFNVERTGSTRVETRDNLLGRGVQFPDDSCYVFWNRDAFPDHQRLEKPHVSQYGCLNDVEQGTGGEVTEIKRA